MTRQVVLLGWPVGHSLSPLMQEAAFTSLGLDWGYSAVAVRPRHLERVLADLAASPSVVGANVTLPHKTNVLRYVQPCRPLIGLTRAANTLVRGGGATGPAPGARDGQAAPFVADNTDVEGFLGTLEHAGIAPRGSRCLILGAGGAARACAAGLVAAGAREVIVAGRVPARAQELVSDLQQAQDGAGGCLLIALGWSELDGALSSGTSQAGDEAAASSGADCSGDLLLINATPVGMWHDAQASPLSPAQVEMLAPGTRVVDLIYRPRTTRLMALAAAAGLQAVGGQEMLVRQGAASLSLWLGEPVGPAVVRTMRQALNRALSGEEAAACSGC